MRAVGASVALAVLLASVGPAAAASFMLSEREQQQALVVGQRSVTNESFGGEWRILQGSGESVEVVTPFHRLALAARHAAFKNEPLKPQDQEKMLTELKDRLMLWVYLQGPSEQFARHFTPRLVVDDREIEPALVQNERTAIRQENGRYLARCVYWFPTKDLTGTARPVLVVRDAEGQPVTRFAIDLTRMR
ncbi:MAG: hypothetical protein DMD91_14500 [Candidatus Rokuibacteriota bacterium]|nr:MAG: hypothetical protein DMD91_14500 [Candidatus Rokubacteria bacterium]